MACGEPEVVATYDGGTVTRESYESWLALHRKTDDPATRRDDITAIALRQRIAELAVADGLDRDGAGRFSQARLENRLLSAALRRHLAAQVVVSEAEVSRYLEVHDEERFRPRQIELSNILRRVPAGADAALRATLRQEVVDLGRRVLAGEDFARLAAAESDSETRYRGGRMGPVALEQLAADVRRAVEELEPGELTPVLEVVGGFAILRCDGIVEAHALSVDEARSRVRDFFHRRDEEQAWQAARAGLLAESTVDVDESAIAGGGDESVVARFGDAVLRRWELAHLLNELPSSPSVERASRPVLRGAIEGHAADHVLAHRARHLGLDRHADHQRRLHWRRLELLAQRKMEQAIEERLEGPSEAEVERAWRADPESYRYPESLDLAVIRLAVEADLGAQLAASRKLARDIVDGSRDFAAAARELSLHESASQGGDLGWRTSRQLAELGPIVLGRAHRLEVGETSEPLRQDDSLWLVRLDGRRPERAMSRDEALSSIRRGLMREARGAARAALQAELLAALRLELR